MIIEDTCGRSYKMGWLRLTKLNSKEYVRRRDLRKFLPRGMFGTTLVYDSKDWIRRYKIDMSFIGGRLELGCADFDSRATKQIIDWAKPVDFSHF